MKNSEGGTDTSGFFERGDTKKGRERGKRCVRESPAKQHFTRSSMEQAKTSIVPLHNIPRAGWPTFYGVPLRAPVSLRICVIE